MQDEAARIREEKERWAARQNGNVRERNGKFVTVSSEPIDALYTPDDVTEIDFFRDIGFPGEFFC